LNLSFLGKLFGTKPAEPVRDVAALTAALGALALKLTVSQTPSRSHVGGVPELPPGVQWPGHEGVPLGFLARLSLAELHGALPVPWLPTSGALLFFYDLDGQPWGFDPKDRGRWAVLHVADLETSARAIETGPMGSVSPVPFRHLGFSPIRSLPSWERDEVQALGLNDAESDALDELAAAPFDGAPRHQVAGYPYPIQGDGMELEAQLVSNGLYCGDASGYDDARAAGLREGSSQWRLLLQFDSDDELGLMWGDAGILYFWVQESAARQGDFRNTWLVLQCS
jgi:uncharacterized protein YwqG